jgi:hypothetical protein
LSNNQQKKEVSIWSKNKKMEKLMEWYYQIR